MLMLMTIGNRPALAHKNGFFVFAPLGSYGYKVCWNASMLKRSVDQARFILARLGFNC